MAIDHSTTLTISAAAAARKLGLGKAKTLALIHDGRLPAKQLDGRIRVRLADLDAFLASLPDASSQAVKSWAEKPLRIMRPVTPSWLERLDKIIACVGIDLTA
jgi:excisionase family DNA binding protein